MAYFDSSKNRALWEIELAGLRKERAAREEGRRGKGLEEGVKEQTSRLTPVHMTYQELLKEEAEAQASQKNAHRDRAASLDMAGRERQSSELAGKEQRKEASAYEK